MDKYIGGYQPTTESKTKPPNTGSSVYISTLKKRRFVKVFTCDCVEEIEEKINSFCSENYAMPLDVKINFPPEGSFILATTIIESTVLR